MSNAGWPCPTSDVNFIALGYREKSRKTSKKEAWDFHLSLSLLGQVRAGTLYTAFQGEGGKGCSWPSALWWCIGGKQGHQGLNDSIPKRLPWEQEPCCVVWIWPSGNFCQLERFCQSLEEAPGAMERSTPRHTHQTPPLWSRSSSFKELVNGGTPFGPLLLRQGPSAAHTLNWFEWDVIHRGQEIERGMPNAALREDRAPFPQNPPTPNLPFGFLSPSVSDLQKEPVQKKDDRAAMNKTVHKPIIIEAGWWAYSGFLFYFLIYFLYMFLMFYFCVCLKVSHNKINFLKSYE